MQTPTEQFLELHDGYINTRPRLFELLVKQEGGRYRDLDNNPLLPGVKVREPVEAGYSPA